MEIAAFFGGPEKLVAAVQQLQAILYAAEVTPARSATWSI